MLIIFLILISRVFLADNLQSSEQSFMLRSDLTGRCRFVTLIKTFAEAKARCVDRSFTTLRPGGKMSPAVGGYIGVVLPCCPFLLFSVIESPRLLQFCPLCVCVCVCVYVGALHGREWIIVAIAKCCDQLLYYCKTIKSEIGTQCRLRLIRVAW
jgi:hypothetical protein